MTFNSNEWDIFLSTTLPAANAANATLDQISNLSSLDFTRDRDMIDVTHKASASSQVVIPGLKTGSFSGEAFITDSATLEAGTDLFNISELHGLVEDGTIIYVRIGRGNARFTFSAYINSIGGTGGTDDAPTTSFTGTISGIVAFDDDVSS